MNTITKYLEDSILIQQGSIFKPNPIGIIERKGWGHPDKLADDIAEYLSCHYSNFTETRYGAVLHHNFDKLCILGGSSRVEYGKGWMTKPICIMVNGRITESFNNENIPFRELIQGLCYDFLKKRLPLLNIPKDAKVKQNLNGSSSPGRVFTKGRSKLNMRHKWFSPNTLEDLPERYRLFSNDTSIGTGFAPLSSAERLVKDLVNYLSHNSNTGRQKWIGTDVKVMACDLDKSIDVIACVPQIANFVKSRSEYISNLSYLKEECIKLIWKYFPYKKINLLLNARDIYEEDEIYLTAIGSSIESGDEGVVGRGNRVNGLITPLRPMNLEGVSGKNPVYHVGKLYNIIANDIANVIHTECGGYVIVNLISKTGGDLIAPWKTIIQMEYLISKDKIIDIIKSVLENIPIITNRIIQGKISMT